MTLSLSLLALLACGGDDKDTSTTDTSTTDTGWGDTGTEDTGTEDTGTTAMSAIRVLHLSPDAPAVDVYVDDVMEAPVVGLEFLSGTPHAEVPAGVHRFRVAPTGTSAASAVIDVSPTMEADVKYTAVAIGRVADIQPLLLVDDAAGLAADKIRVQVAHAASAVGQVDIWNLTGGTPSLLLENVDFGAAATLPDLPAGAYRVGIDVNNDAAPDVTFSLPSLPGGTSVNLFAVSDASDTVWLAAQLPNGDVAPISADR